MKVSIHMHICACFLCVYMFLYISFGTTFQESNLMNKYNNFGKQQAISTRVKFIELNKCNPLLNNYSLRYATDRYVHICSSTQVSSNTGMNKTKMYSYNKYYMAMKRTATLNLINLKYNVDWKKSHTQRSTHYLILLLETSKTGKIKLQQQMAGQ